MRILVLALNYAPEPVGCAVYTTGMCEALAARGHEVEVVSAQPYYPAWRVPPEWRTGWRRTTERGVAVTRCPLYVPARPTGPRRILHHLSFALSALVPMVRTARRFRPDVVWTVAPSILAAPVAVLAGRLARVPTWLHVQDFEVEAAFATGLVDGTSAAAGLARRLERGIARRFDHLSSIGPEMCAKLSRLVPRTPVVEFRNWASVEPQPATVTGDAYRREWGLGNRHIALYSGNIANKQGIEIILDAARRLVHRHDLAFVVCGDGPNRDRFAEAAAGMPNIVLKPLQPRERLAELLALADVHLLPQRADAADLVLPSKLPNMFASGRPVVVTAAPGTGLAREAEDCGIVTMPEDAVAFADAIVALIDDSPRRARMGAEAKRRVADHWSRAAILDSFERDLGVCVS